MVLCLSAIGLGYTGGYKAARLLGIAIAVILVLVYRKLFKTPLKIVKCDKCGHEIHPGLKFCGECGHKRRYGQ